MTPKYWTGVIVAMLAVFGAGMLVARGIHRGKQLITDNFPASLPLLNAGFKVDGQRIGDIRRLQFLRSEPGRVDSAVLTINAASPEVVDHIAGCALMVNSGGAFNGSTRFSCANHADSTRLDLQPFGHVILLPEGKQVALYVPEDAAESIHRRAYRGAGSDSGDIDIDQSHGGLSISVNRHEIFHAGGDSTGGSLVIRDGAGHPIVEINGDDSGGRVKITDSNGKTRLDLHGKSSPHKADNDTDNN